MTNQILQKSKFYSKMVWRTARASIDKSRPYLSHLFITRNCNLKCKMCNVWKTPSEVRETKTVFKMIDQLDKLGVFIVLITGGEPTLRKDLFQIIEHIAAKGMTPIVNTNGTLPSNIYEMLAQSPVSGIGVSLHSHQPEIHEKITQVKGSWGKAVRAVELLRDAGKNVYVCCTVTALNINEVPKIVTFCANELKVPTSLNPSVLGATDSSYFTRGTDTSLGNLREEYIQSVFNEIEFHNVLRTRTYVKNAFKILANQRVNLGDCMAGEMFYAVMPDGRFGICQDIMTDLNILQDDFLALAKSSEFKRRARMMRNKCPGCAYSCYYDTLNMLRRPWEALELRFRLMHFKMS